MNMRGVIHGGRELIGKSVWWTALLGGLAAFPLAVAIWDLAPGGRELAIFLVTLGGAFLAAWFPCHWWRARASSVVSFLLGGLFYGCAIAVVARAFVDRFGPLW